MRGGGRDQRQGLHPCPPTPPAQDGGMRKPGGGRVGHVGARSVGKQGARTGELAMQVCEQRPCVWVLLVNKCVCCCASSDNVLAATTLGGVGRRRPGCHVSVYLFFAFSRTRSGIHAPIQPQQQQQQHDWQCWPRDARDKRRRCTAAPRNALVRRAAAVPHCTSGDALAMRTALPWRLRSAGARAAALHASAGACGSGASSRAGRHVQRRADATHRLPPRRAVMSAAGASCTSRATVSPSCAGG